MSKRIYGYISEFCARAYQEQLNGVLDGKFIETAPPLQPEESLVDLMKALSTKPSEENAHILSGVLENGKVQWDTWVGHGKIPAHTSLADMLKNFSWVQGCWLTQR